MSCSNAVGNTFYNVKIHTKRQETAFCSFVSDLMTTAVEGKSSVELSRTFAMEFETSVIYEYFWLCVM